MSGDAGGGEGSGRDCSAMVLPPPSPPLPPPSPLAPLLHLLLFPSSSPCPPSSQLQDLGLVAGEDGVAGGHTSRGGDDTVVVAGHRHHCAAVVVIPAVRSGDRGCEAGGLGQEVGWGGSPKQHTTIGSPRHALLPYQRLDPMRPSNTISPVGTHGLHAACVRSSAPAAGTCARAGSADAILDSPLTPRDQSPSSLHAWLYAGPLLDRRAARALAAR